MAITANPPDFITGKEYDLTDPRETVMGLVMLFLGFVMALVAYYVARPTAGPIAAWVRGMLGIEDEQTDLPQIEVT